jgi:hypothetical protein
MIDIYLDSNGQAVWLSYEYLQSKEILRDTINKWSTRDICTRMYLNGRAYIKYDTIPEPTRAKLLTMEGIRAEYNRKKIENTVYIFTKELQAAYKSMQFPVYVREIQSNTENSKLKDEQVREFARKACVIEHVLWLHQEYHRPNKLEALFYAYSSIYPNDYSMKNRFCMMLKKAREEGILSVAIDKRIFRELAPKYTAVHIQLAEAFLSDSRNFSIRACHEKIVDACNELNMSAPSFWWVRDYYRANKQFIDTERFGKANHEKENGLYAKIIPAKNRNTQWQMDGWEIPIYGKRLNNKGGWEIYCKYVLVAVMDAHSRKMIGYCVAESENTAAILKALEIAVKNTGVLPFEIVADNHSFNKTKEAAHIKAAMDKIGVKWTVDSNPRRKAILERSFRTLGEMHFKDEYGYIGQGVRSKMKGGRMPQELIDEYTKNQSRFLTWEQITTITMRCILDYNAKEKPTTKQSPNQRYELSKDKCSYAVSEFTRMSLFCKQSEFKVQHGQITIKRGMYTYEYQIPSAYSTPYNGKTVGVLYHDFDEIYLFDLETNEPICSVKEKNEIHGAAGDQSETDTQNLYKNTGRMKGNQSKECKRKNAIDNGADTINPNAIDTINKIKTPKELVKTLEQNKELQKLVIEQDVNTAKVTDLPEISAIKYKRANIKDNANKSPFAPKNIAEIGKIVIE